MSDEITSQRIYRCTVKKLQLITTVHKPKVSVPSLLDSLADKELAKYPELKEISK